MDRNYIFTKGDKLKNKDFFTEIEDRLGKGSIASDDKKLLVIPTGSLALDVSTGVGGIPRGKIIELFGAEGTFKTTMALEIARNNMELGGKTLYIDVENMLDYRYANKLSHDPNFVSNSVIQPNTAEDAFIAAEAGIDSGDFSLIIFDSVGALAPKKEKEDDFEDANVALVPRLMSKFLRRASYGIREKDIAFLFLNQVRDKIGGYVQGYNTPGGHALKHFTSLIISLGKGREIRSGDIAIGAFSKFVIKKNKLAPPFRSYTIPFIFGEGIDRYNDFVTFAEVAGALQKSGSFYKFDDETIAQGKNKTIEVLKENQELLDKIRERVYNVTSRYERIVEDVSEEEEIIDEHELED